VQRFNRDPKKLSIDDDGKGLLWGEDEMSSNQLCITSNVFVANFVFDREIENFDFFKVEGIYSARERFTLFSKVIRKIQSQEKTSFASYTPAPNENYVVGYLAGNPAVPNFEVEGLKVLYEGKRPLPPTGAARRTLTELLNKSKFRELRNILWSPGGHTFYPKKGKDLNHTYRNCNLIMFRGPFFRYNILSDGKIILSLDSATHYIRSEPFLNEIRRRESLDWFVKEIEERRKVMEAQRRDFTGIHFFYDLYKNDVTIDSVDPRPISEISLPKPTIVNGIECKTIAQYLRARYVDQPVIKNLNDSQPGLKGQEFTYAPQFLYRTVPLEEIPDDILNDQTFFMDRRPRPYRNTQRPAVIRWEKMNEYYFQYNFQYVDLGPGSLKMNGPLTFPISNHFEKPKLLTNSSEPITVEELTGALSSGLHKSSRINKVFLYSVMDTNINGIFYESMVEYAKSRFGVDLPHQAVPLESDLGKMRTQLENSIRADGVEATFCIAIIPGDSNLHEEVTNICGELSIPSKCITIGVVEAVCLEGAKMHLRDTLASIITRAGGIPWILYDRLHYGCYVATDVGRSRSEYWAMSIVYDRDGKFTIKQGKLTVGEDLDEQSVRHCVGEAHRYAPSSDSLIYLRDGEVFDTERRMFEKAIEDLPYPKAAIVSIKEDVPYRIFRRFGSRIAKPLSGDYYFLDDRNVVICAAGGEEYEHGTPKPIVAEVIPMRGDIDIKVVVEDLFKLTYLNWGSPGRSYSVPAPVRLAHKSASELSKGIRRFGSPF